MIEVIQVGTGVTLLNGSEAVVSAICIRGTDAVTYECSWWDGSSRQTDWFLEKEFSSLGQERRGIGFKRL